MKINLTEEQHAALLAVKAHEGRNWKSAVRHWWETCTYPEWADSQVLQSLRNSQDFGPSGLVSVKV